MKDKQGKQDGERTAFECWALVELMGHQKTAGLVSEQEIAGHGMIRVDVTNEDGETRYTRFYAPGALYSLTPVAKEIAVAYAARYVERPVQQYELPGIADRSDEDRQPDDGE